MSDSDHSTITYTSVSFPIEDDSDIGSPGVDGPPIMPEDPYAYIMAAYQVPPSSDYVPGPEEPDQAPPSPIYLPYVPKPVYPEYIPPKDDSDPEEEPEGDDEDPEEDPADYPADRDDDEEEEEEPSRDDADDEDKDEDEEEEEEEEHLALADSVLPVHHRPEITLPPRKRLGVDLGPRYEIGESSAIAATRPIRGRRVDYGFVGTMDTEIRRQRAEEVSCGIRDVWVDPREAVKEVAPITLEGVNARVTELTAVQEQDTQDIYAVIRDTQDRQTQIYQSVKTLFDDSQYHYEIARLLDQEALVSREVWGRSIEVSYMTCSEIMALHYVVMGQQAVISQLQAADLRSQVVTSVMLQADHQRQVQLTKALNLLSIMGYSQLADCIDLLFCLATQYRGLYSENGTKEKDYEVMIDEGVTIALAAHDATRNGNDSHTSGTGARRPVQVARECTYPDFLKCQPLNFKGTKGVVGFTQWFEKMESVYSISNYTVACQVKFATCTLQGNALTWWNSHVKTTTPEAAHAMP
ncbi:hypothetical protein Tco_0576656 [Tanacetum coccineum]